MKLFQVIAILIFSMFYFGCGEEDEKDTAATATAATETAAVSFANSLAGSWSSGCVTEETEEGVEGAMDVYVFDSGTITATKSIAGDENCENFMLQFVAAHTYSIGDEVATVVGAKNFDLTIVKYEMTPLTEDAVGFLNQGTLCESSDWAVDVTKDVTGKTCNFDGEEGKAFPTSAGVVMRDIIKLADDGSSFQIGDQGEDEELDGSTEAKRPVALDTNITYTKAP